MRKISSISLILALFLCVFTGCQCQHEWEEATCIGPQFCSLCGETGDDALGHLWKEATCLEPKTCSTCGQTEGKALGHDWLEASCEAPRTCSVCGATERAALGHSFSKWEIRGETMHRVCERCPKEESTDLDRAAYLNDQLIGRWDCTELLFDNGPTSDASDAYKGPIPYMVISENNLLRFFNGSAYFDGTLEFIEYEAADGLDYYYFYGMQDNTPQKLFVLEISPEEGSVVYTYENYYTLRFDLESEDSAMLREALVGTWNSTKIRPEGSSEAEYTGSTITFRDDHSFTATLDDTQFEGTWFDPELNETEGWTRYTYTIQYRQDGHWNWQVVFIDHDHEKEETKYFINFDNEYLVYYEPEQIS